MLPHGYSGRLKEFWRILESAIIGGRHHNFTSIAIESFHININDLDFKLFFVILHVRCPFYESLRSASFQIPALEEHTLSLIF